MYAIPTCVPPPHLDSATLQENLSKHSKTSSSRSCMEQTRSAQYILSARSCNNRNINSTCYKNGSSTQRVNTFTPSQSAQLEKKPLCCSVLQSRCMWCQITWKVLSHTPSLVSTLERHVSIIGVTRYEFQTQRLYVSDKYFLQTYVPDQANNHSLCQVLTKAVPEKRATRNKIDHLMDIFKKEAKKTETPTDVQRLPQKTERA